MTKIPLALLLASFVATASTSQSIKLNRPLAETSDGDVTKLRATATGYTVYHGDLRFDSVNELFSTPTDGSGDPVRLNPDLAPEGDVHGSFEVSPDGMWAVYRADQEIDGVMELYSVPVDGSADPVKLNGPLIATGDVTDFEITPDSARVVFRADANTDGSFELFSRTIDGSAGPDLLSGTLVGGGSVIHFIIHPSSSSVIFRSDREINDRIELYRVPISGGTVIKLNGPIIPFGGDVREYSLSGDGSTVVYRADQDVNNVDNLYATDSSGTGPVNKLLTVGSILSLFRTFRVSHDGAYVAYLSANPLIELHSVATDGVSSSVTFGDLQLASVSRNYVISPDGQWLVWAKDGIWSGPIDGSSPPAQIASIPTNNTLQLEVTSDSQTVVFDYWDALASVPIDGSSPMVVLEDQQTVIQNDVRISADGNHVVYRSSGPTELKSVPTLGGPSVTLSPDLPIHGGPESFHVGPSNEVVFSTEEQDGLDHVYSVPADGASSATITGSANLETYVVGDVSNFELVKDGREVLYLANEGTQFFTEVTRVSLTTVDERTNVTGGLFAASFKTDPSQRWVLFTNGPLIHASDLETGGAPVWVNPTIDGSLTESSSTHTLFTSLNQRTLYASRNDGSQPEVSLFNLLGLTIEEFKISSDGVWAVLETFGPGSVFSTRVDGSGPPVRLTPPAGLTYFADFHRISPDGTQVLYSYSESIAAPPRLFITPIDGSGTSTTLFTASLSDTRFDTVEFSPDSSHVVFIGDATIENTLELYAAPADASSPAVQLAGGFANSASDVRSFQIAPTNDRVVYLADQDIDEVVELYSRAIDGSGSSVKLHPPLDGDRDVEDVLIEPDGAHVIFRADPVNGTVELFRAPIDGSSTPVRVHTPFAPGRAVAAYSIENGAGWVAYLANQRIPDVNELFIAPLDGSEPSRRVSDDLVPGGQVEADFRFVRQRRGIVYRASVFDHDTTELFLRLLERPHFRTVDPPADGGTRPGS